MVGDQANSAAATMQGGVEQGYEYASEYARNAWESASDSAYHDYDARRERIKTAHQEYPLGLGLGCLDLGVVVGMVLPRTRKEGEWYGDAADDIKRRATRQGEQLVESGKCVAQHTANFAVARAEQEDLSPASVVEQVERATANTIQAAGNAVKEEGLDPQSRKAKTK